MYTVNSGFLHRRNLFFILLTALSLLIPVVNLSAEEGYLFSFGSSNKLKITERSNVSVYENGAFKGLTYNESRAVLEYDQYNDGFSTYSGNYYVYEASKNDTRLIANPVNLNEYCEIDISDRGVYRLPPDALVPVLRSFPVFPDKELVAGDSWRDFGERIVDPDGNGRYTRVKFYCEYKYAGIEDGRLGPKHVIKAQYAMRYKPGDSDLYDPSLTQISGRHVVDIYIDAEDTSSIFIRDKLDEEYRYNNGRSMRHSGFILTWYNDVLGLDRTVVKRDAVESVTEEDIDDVEIIERDEGIALSLQNLHFVPDSAEILPEERGRLQSVYNVLQSLGAKKVLVVGHTADIGSKESQYVLSRERAMTVINKLVELGMQPSAFIYEGRGGDEPIGDNSTSEGRSKNRRVELIILDD